MSSLVTASFSEEFTFDTIDFMRAINVAFKQKRQLVDSYDCSVCEAKVSRVSVSAHVFSNHTEQRRPKQLVQSSVNGPHFTCICGYCFLAHFVEQFVLHFVKCLGFKDTPKPVLDALTAFSLTPEYALCKALTVKALSAETDTKNDNTLINSSKIMEKINMNIDNPPFTPKDISKVFGFHVSSDRIKSKLHVHNLRIRLINHVSRYLCDNISDRLTCHHCHIPINSLQFIQHCIGEHLDETTYGSSAVVCPNCTTYICRLLYASGYHYACFVVHLVECLIKTFQVPKNDEYNAYMVKFNQICIANASHSPYVVNNISPGFEYATDKYFSLDEFVYSARPDDNDSTSLGEDTVRRMFNLGTSDLQEEFTKLLRIDHDIRVPHNNGECKVCIDDMHSMIKRLDYDRSGVSTDVFYTPDQFKSFFPGVMPSFISNRETPLPEPIIGLSGIKLFMLEVAARLPNRLPQSIPEEERKKYLYATHTYVYRGKFSAIMGWLRNNSHRVFVFPNSTLCWDEFKFDHIFDPMDLTNTHRHVIIVYDTYETYQEFSRQEFNFDEPYRTAAENMIKTGRARNYRVQISGKVSKQIISPQRLFGATIYLSRFKIPTNVKSFCLSNQRNPGNEKDLLEEFSNYQVNLEDSVAPTNSAEANALRQCYNSLTSDHHQMTCLMSRHSKVQSYSLYKNGLTDWYNRAHPKNGILWLYLAHNLRTFAEDPIPSRPDDIEWPDRHDLSRTYLPLYAAKAVLPGYVSNHPAELIADIPEHKESLDRLRSFGGVLFDIPSTTLYSDQERCYVRLALNCSKQLVKYIQTISTRSKDISGMIMMCTTASVAIVNYKKMVAQRDIAISDYRKKQSEFTAKYIQQTSEIFTLSDTLDKIQKILVNALESNYTSLKHFNDALVIVVQKVVQYTSQVKRLTIEQRSDIAQDILRDATMLYETMLHENAYAIDEQLISRHLAGQK